MKALRSFTCSFSLLFTVLLLVGCGHKEKDGHGHRKESPSGASFNARKGIILTDETRVILGVEVADVTEQRLPKEFRFNVQVFSEKHRHTSISEDHSGCDVQASGLVPSENAAEVKSGLPVQLLKAANIAASGGVLAVQKALAQGEREIILFPHLKTLNTN